MRYKTILDTIGNTPLVKLNLTNKAEAAILAKLEFLNPSGSIKDRMVLYMVEMAEKRGLIKPGATLIEATTGNTGISLAMIGVAKEYKVIAVMPENMTKERQKLMKAFGAKVILTSAVAGPVAAIRKAKLLSKQIQNSWLVGQFENPDNIVAHKETTGREIIEQTGGKINAFVAGVGTGGTLMGVAKALKKINSKVRIVAVEPAESAVLSGEKAADHNIQGIGEGFIPKLVDLKMVDKIIKVSTGEAEEMARILAKKEGLLVGTSLGANVFASLKIAKEIGSDKVVVTVLPDRGERYLSQKLFNL